MNNVYIHPAYLNPVILTTSSGQKIDITSQVKEINVYESLFSNILTATITVMDTPATRLIQNGMIAAKDKISFEFAGLAKDLTPEKSIKVDLFVYKVQSSGPVGQTLQTSIISLGSEEFYKNQTKEISRHFDDTVSSLIKKICNELEIKNIEVEETDEKYKFISTYHSPLEIINFLTTKAISKRNKNDHNYVFYQDIDKKYHFVSLGSLMQKPSKFGTNSSSGFIHTMPLVTTSDMMKNMVLGYESADISPLKNAMGGMYTSQITTYDITNKLYALWTFDLDMIYDTQTHLSTKKIIDDNDDEFKKTLTSSYMTRYAHKTEYCYDCNKDKGFQNKIGGPEDIILPKISTMEQLNQLSIKLSINGNSTIRAGDVFYFGRPIQQSLSSDKLNKDIVYNGKYLAVDIAHSLKYNVMGKTYLEYKTIIRGIKDSIGDE